MKLNLTTYGFYLSKSGNRFVIKADGKKDEISVDKVEQIVVTTKGVITTDAINLAVENNIDFIMLNNYGKPLGRFWHSKFGSISTIRKKQLELENTYLGFELVKDWISTKMNNQKKLLKKFSNGESLNNSTISKMNNYVQKINEMEYNYKNIKEERDKIQNLEANVSRMYFKTLSELLPEEYRFECRSRNPAKDYFNCLLNYGYGILYGQIERSCIIAGLDPYIGILHRDNYNRTALVYDMIEPYRYYVDKTVFELCIENKINNEFFDELKAEEKSKNGYYLNKEGKQLLISKYNEIMDKKIKYDGKNTRIEDTILKDCHKVSNKILKYI
ncbi:CRISPR-associated endonuclease Cas1 [Methanococcus voltae]|uniref:CRISPR-associated endonuclease Cas1 n=1 Tax=Methanococcus voltae TaxID=2188 RepID=A0A8J7RFH9_METVO|nr:CRISPR-associated endonuclease Cas1 [Methanococcus voltae]MBP2173278.1 CRISPR-associated protein Cas1 [Methanococcus voltae]MBP2202232.1 CRISPR-associated protein Cas1 [Methanococcus voltae]